MSHKLKSFLAMCESCGLTHFHDIIWICFGSMVSPLTREKGVGGDLKFSSRLDRATVSSRQYKHF